MALFKVILINPSNEVPPAESITIYYDSEKGDIKETIEWAQKQAEEIWGSCENISLRVEQEKPDA